MRQTVTPFQVWGGAEYLCWWLKSGNTPPLVTSGNPTDAYPGALGQPGTSTLFGGPGALDHNATSGFRATIGIGLEGGWGVEFSGFWLQNQSLTFSRASDAQGNPATFVPIFRNNPLAFDPNPHEGSFTIADPLFLNPNNQGPAAGPAFGRIDIEATTRFSGLETNAVRRVSVNQRFALDLLFGYRHLALDESLSFAGFFSNPPNGGVGFDTRQDFREAFTTQNRFDGGQIGLGLSWIGNRFSLDVLGKVAFGASHQIVNASGTLTESGAGTFTNPPGPNTYTNQGSLFVLPSSVGQQSQNSFSVVPQVKIQLGYNLTNNLRATIGYDYLFWSNVVRPGDQIDRRINDSQVPNFGSVLTGANVPTPQFNRTDFFAHGLNVGLTLRY